MTADTVAVPDLTLACVDACPGPRTDLRGRRAPCAGVPGTAHRREPWRPGQQSAPTQGGQHQPARPAPSTTQSLGRPSLGCRGPDSAPPCRHRWAFARRRAAPPCPGALGTRSPVRWGSRPRPPDKAGQSWGHACGRANQVSEHSWPLPRAARSVTPRAGTRKHAAGWVCGAQPGPRLQGALDVQSRGVVARGQERSPQRRQATPPGPRLPERDPL